MTEIRVLELYSGIGGMHFALKQSRPDAKVVAAVDINDHVNKVYAHNFPNTKVMDKGIEGFSIKYLNNLKFNTVLMSPPCQPFTRIGLQKDVNDPRTKSFMHFLSILPKLENLPKYILLENVKGFEISVAHTELCKTLEQCGYQRQEFLLTPRQFGIPNSRLRYFLLAKKEKFHSSLVKQDGTVWETLPLSLGELEKAMENGHEQSEDDQEPSFKRARVEKHKNISNEDSKDTLLEVHCQPIKNYVDEGVTSEEYKVPDKVKNRYINVMDIVTPESTISTCFTKSYSQFAEATGSVLCLNTDAESLKNSTKRNPDDFNLRYFTPREVAKLMCFPEDFSFPDWTTKKQRYKMLGNSLNVKVVSYLISLLLLKTTDELSAG